MPKIGFHKQFMYFRTHVFNHPMKRRPITVPKDKEAEKALDYDETENENLPLNCKDKHMELFKVDLTKFSNIICESSVSDDCAILYVKASGSYGVGSLGNPDGLYLVSHLAAHYFVYEPICIILDLRDLEYTWGNTIYRALNFFDEIGRDEDEKDKLNIIITSSKNQEAINGILERVVVGKRFLCTSYEDALNVAIKNVEEYLE